MLSLTQTTALLAAAALPLARAHPHGERSLEATGFHESSRRALSLCSSKRSAEASIQRRAALADRIRKERGISLDKPFLSRRQYGLNTSHLSDITGVGAYANPEVLFDANTTCVLGPDVTEGPYYVAGEYVRYDVTEDQAGVPLYLDVELVDTSTCENIPDVAVEIWHANATGVYSGVDAQGNGVGTADPTNLNNTFLRGVQYTNADGYVQFLTVFPGHYTGRAQHIHLASHVNGSWEGNGTMQGLYMSHVGQLFFDTSLISEVEATSPYSSNTQNQTSNSDDMILLQEADVYDPFVEYVLLGSDITDGILAWASLGVNTTEANAISAAATLTSGGGVASNNTMPGGGAPPNGTASVSGSAVPTKK